MARIPREIVDSIRERTDIAAVVGRHVALKRAGRNLVGLCPFHQEKTPSFHVIPDKGIYHCFGCQAGGDAFRFLMTLEGLSFVEAVKELAGPAGVTIEERELTAAERRALAARATAYDVLEAACRFYENQLWTQAGGAEARAYLERRALAEETARSARLGWAPGGWSRLLDHLHREGFDPETVAEAGVARPRKEGDGYYDTLRERVTVPIRDERGRVIAFGGRLLAGDGPKYLNTPETRLYEKSNVLYALDTARGAITKLGRAVVVEGYFDVLSLHQHGFTEAVATCGTALTPAHLDKLRRLARDVVLVMDADAAGQRAAERSLDLCVAAGVQPWRIDVPFGKDPDECMRAEGGPEAFGRAIEAREPLFEWVVDRRLDAYGHSAMSRERVLEDVLPLLDRVHDPLVVRRVARRLDLPEDAVLGRLRERARSADKPAPEAAPEAAAPPPWHPHRDTVHLLWLLVHRYAEVADLVERLDPDLLRDQGPAQEIVARLVSGEPVATVCEDHPDPTVQKLLRAVVARDKLYEVDEAPRAVLQIADRLTRPRWAAELGDLGQRIEKAAATGDHGGLTTAVKAKKVLHDRERAVDDAIRRGDLPRAMDLLRGERAP